MTSFQTQLAAQILKEHFGEITRDVAMYILKKEFTTLRVIAKDTKIPLGKVKRSLAVLIQHKIVTFERGRGCAEYHVDISCILRVLRYPQYMYIAKKLYGDEAELLVEELLHHGEARLSQVAVRVTERLNHSLQEGQEETSVYKARDAFKHLAQTQFIYRCPCVSLSDQAGDSSLPSFDENETLQYIVPDVDFNVAASKASNEREEPAAKKIKLEKTEATSVGDEGIYWSVNVDRFDLYLRDQSLVMAAERKVGKKAGEIMAAFLRLNEVKSQPDSPVTNHISYNEVFQSLPKDLGISKTMFDQYLTLLLEDSVNILNKVGESGGGMFVIDFQKAFTSLCRAHMESYVQEKYGSKSLRIFRLLLTMRHLEQKQIEECAMVPSKDAKEMLYQLFGEHIVSVTEVPKTPDHAPSRTFYLFSVNLNQVSRMVLQSTFKMAYNVMRRREAETLEHKRLLEKQQRLEAILASLDGADDTQKAEVEEMMSPAEKSQLSKVKHIINKLEQCEMQLDDAIFVIETYLKYIHMK